MQRLLSIPEVAKMCPFSQASLRQLKMKNTCNFNRCVFTRGDRIFIDQDVFEVWMKAHGNRIKANGKKIRGTRYRCMLTNENAHIENSIYRGDI
jgi:hypothetical protein